MTSDAIAVYKEYTLSHAEKESTLFARAAALLAPDSDAPHKSCSSRCLRRACSDCLTCCALLGARVVDRLASACCCQELSSFHASARLRRSIAGMGTRTDAPCALDKFTYDAQTRDPKRSALRPISTPTHAQRATRRIGIVKTPKNQQRARSTRLRAPTFDRAPSPACNTPAPRRSKPPTCVQEPRPRTKVKPTSIASVASSISRSPASSRVAASAFPRPHRAVARAIHRAPYLERADEQNGIKHSNGRRKKFSDDRRPGAPCTRETPRAQRDHRSTRIARAIFDGRNDSSARLPESRLSPRIARRAGDRWGTFSSTRSRSTGSRAPSAGAGVARWRRDARARAAREQVIVGEQCEGDLNRAAGRARGAGRDTRARRDGNERVTRVTRAV